MNHMRTNIDANLQRLRNATNSLRMAAYLLQTYQGELNRVYQSAEITSILTLVRQCMDDLQRMQQSCESLQGRVKSIARWSS